MSESIRRQSLRPGRRFASFANQAIAPCQLVRQQAKDTSFVGFLDTGKDFGSELFALDTGKIQQVAELFVEAIEALLDYRFDAGRQPIPIQCGRLHPPLLFIP